MNQEIQNLLIDYYYKYPLGRDKLYSVVHPEHPEISRRMIASFLANYEPHQLHRMNKNYSNSTTTTITLKPRMKYHADLSYVDKLAGYNDNVNYLLTVVENFSHYCFVRTLIGKSSQEVAQQMESILLEIQQSGPQMKLLCSDNGTEFKSEFSDLLTRYQIRHEHSLPHAPHTNGAVEVFNKNIKTMIYRRITLNQNNRYIDYLQELVTAYNNSVCSNHNRKPADVFFNRIDLEPIIQKKQEKIDKVKEDIKNSSHSNLFEIGDNVRISVDILYSFFPTRYQPPNGFKKSYNQNYSSEIFTIMTIVRNRNFIQGYRLRFNQIEFSFILVRPHYITKIDVNKLINRPVVNHPQRILREQRPNLPVPNIVERVNNPQDQRRYQPPRLQDIFEDLDII